MSRERIEEIFSKLETRIKFFRGETCFPDDHPITYEYREYYLEAETLYESLSDNDKRELEGKMGYLRQFSPRSHTRR
ncbi:hypothetical protein [Fusobacterium sp. HMSC073F01]|uniref:hypothetical protein n=1 Tax=Fusobacterium sp. HMSC073F01 TaxID=1739251 RepID=UPI0008A2A843|nr:hypothetical protein [Fusobacterium sp. HMSC073F01]OFL79139.1 hypothetical protein HMPREF2747_05580 [Fusobacterium sp. HMSC073F01]